MSRPITYVTLDIASLLLEVMDRKDDHELAEWTRSLARCLAARNPELNVFGAKLLSEVQDYRRSEQERKNTQKLSALSGGKTRKAADSGGKTRKAADSGGKTKPKTDSVYIQNKTEHNRTLKTEKKKHSFPESEFFPFEKFRSSLPEWSEEKCRYWHQQAETYSGANGGRYLDWRLAVMGWDRKTPYQPKPAPTAYNPTSPK